MARKTNPSLIAVVALAAFACCAGWFALSTLTDHMNAWANPSSKNSSQSSIILGTCSVARQQHKPVIELFTSEGCDSCPPAERSLGQLAQYGVDPASVIALAWHVDYWDYIGWKDVFAQPAFAQRQRTLAQQSAARGGPRGVYTPQFFVDGAVSGPNPSGLRASVQTALQTNTKAQATSYTLQLKQAGNQISAQVQGVSTQPIRLQLLLTQNQLKTNVTAGENKGVTLQHSHVVRAVLADQALSGPQIQTIQASWPQTVKGPAIDPAHSQWVALMTDAQTGVALQAINLPVCTQ